jgi:5-methylcytosine-specific restriction endonuclease McrA
MPFKDKEAHRVYMREYHRNYYLKNTEALKEKTLISNRKIRARNRAFLKEVKESSPCTDCGKYFPYYVMHFDHIFEKSASLANLSRACVSIERLQQEIDNCELVCSNCHAIRTHERKQGDDDDMSEWL